MAAASRAGGRAFSSRMRRSRGETRRRRRGGVAAPAVSGGVWTPTSGIGGSWRDGHGSSPGRRVLHDVGQEAGMADTRGAETVTAREANQQFSRLLAEVASGRSFVITRRGVPVARLTPEPAPDGRPPLTPEQE